MRERPFELVTKCRVRWLVDKQVTENHWFFFLDGCMQYWVSWLFEFNQVQGGFDLIRIRVFVSKFHSSEQDRSTNRLPVTVIPLLQGTLGTKRTWRGIVVAKQRNIFTGKPLFYDIINVFTMIKIPVSRWEESLKKIQKKSIFWILRLDGGVKFMTLWWIWYQKWQKSLMRHWVPFLCRYRSPLGHYQCRLHVARKKRYFGLKNGRWDIPKNSIDSLDPSKIWWPIVKSKQSIASSQQKLSNDTFLT